MSEQDHRNPFEEHIESEHFDVSKLEPGQTHTDLDPALQALLDSLPQPLDYRIWDEELSEQQKVLCAHLAQEIIERVIRPNYMNDMIDMEDNDLLLMLTVPVALAMITQERLIEQEKPAVIQPPDDRDLADEVPVLRRDLLPPEDAAWGDAMANLFRDLAQAARQLWNRLFRRY